MCKELGIDTSKYSRIETDSQKPTAEMLEQIAKVLGVSLPDIISGEPIIIQNSASNNGTQGIGHIEHFYTDQKELYEKIISAQKEEIERLVKHEEQMMALLAKRK